MRRYRRGELEQKLAGAGFEVLHSTSFVALLSPFMLVSLRLGRDRDIEFHPPRRVNRLLGGIMDIERRLIGAGVRLWFGGSRLVVASTS